MPYAGRGGTGNIQQAQQVPLPATEQLDLEAANSPDAPFDISRVLAERKKPTRSSLSFSTAAEDQIGYSPYVKTGRGGAGNYFYETQTQAKHDTTTTDTPQKKGSTPLYPPRQSSLPIFAGRGGAGNFEQPPPSPINPAATHLSRKEEAADERRLEDATTRPMMTVPETSNITLPRRPEKAYVIGADKSMAGREAVATVSILD